MKWIGAKSPDTGYTSVKELIESRHLTETRSKIVNMPAAIKMLGEHTGPILIVGDYDVDGIMAAAIMYVALMKSGHRQTKVRLPKRLSEGYGISRKIIDEITEPDTLIITVDNGIAAVEPIKLAKDRGYKVIITDHHQPPKGDLPPADIIIDPHYTGGDYVDFCGAGIALMLAEELLGEGNADKLYPYAYAATIADVVPLTGDNRRICRKGMEVIPPKAMRTLMEALNVDFKTATEEDYKFSINPAINAISRIFDDADTAFKLFTARTVEDMEKYAAKLQEANVIRKKTVSEHMTLAQDVIDAECLYGDCPLIINLPDGHLGVLGIIAGRLSEEYGVPTIVLTEQDGILKGSARVPAVSEGYNIKAELDKVSELLIGYGGHTMAAGLSLKAEKLSDLRAAMKTKIETKEKVGVFDLSIKEEEIEDTIKELRKYAPYGPANEVPVVKIEKLKLVPRYGKFTFIIGETQKAVKMFSPECTILYFCEDPEDFSLEDTVSLDVFGELSINYYMGKADNQIILRDVPHKNVVKKSALAERLSARAASYKI